MLANSNFNIEFTVNIKGSEQKKSLRLYDFEIVNFVGQTTPQSCFVDDSFTNNNRSNKLYRPIMPNYPGFDFFYYDTHLKTFYLFQITINENPMDHVMANDNAFEKNDSQIFKAINAWFDYFPSGTKFIEIWMVNQVDLYYNNDNQKRQFSSTRSARLNRMNLIYFNEMNSLPVLASH